MMKNYIQQIIELFGHNEYSLTTRRKVQRWLADDNHAEEKKRSTSHVVATSGRTESTSRNATVHITDATKSGNAVCRFR